MKRILVAALLLATLVSSEAAQKKVLLEIFTNSHCPLCPSSHTTIDAYLQNGLYKDRVTFLYYHMAFPYPDDLLHQQNPADANGRNTFYGTFSSTPRAVFDGQIQNNNYTNWASIINGLAVQESPFSVVLQGNSHGATVDLTASITQTGSVPSSTLSAQFIAVETVPYSGRNGITVHKNTMRKMSPGPQGRPLSIGFQQTIQLKETLTLNPLWDSGKLGYLVFIQDAQTKAIYQSEFIAQAALVKTDVERGGTIPLDFTLEQNYPNPFNPATTIAYTIPRSAHVRLAVYDVTGRTVAVLADKEMQAGRYTAIFDAGALPSGVFFFRIQAGAFSAGKKMVLVK